MIESSSSLLTPITVIGTGILHQLLPKISDLAAEEQRRLSPLLNWDELLKEVASRHNLNEKFNPQLAKNMPILQWEELTRGLAETSLTKLRSFEAEKILKSSVIDILNLAQEEAKRHLNEKKLKDFISVTGNHIVSLNFDTIILGNGDYTRIKNDKKSRLLHFNQNNKIFWFPHGSTKKTSSVCLGLRQYGFLANTLEKKLRNFKAYERSFNNDNKSLLKEKDFDKLISTLAYGKEIDPGNLLIGHIFLAPLILFGVGLSESEWGLWWVLNQRARNFARVPHLKPPTIIIVDKNDPRQNFWSMCPAGITPIYVNNWDEGWIIFLEYLEKFK